MTSFFVCIRNSQPISQQTFAKMHSPTVIEIVLSLMEQHVFRLLLNIEVATEKVSQFMMPIKSIRINQLPVSVTRWQHGSQIGVANFIQ
jgi:hypothetical protein